jgi:hypothetical protein
MTTVVSRRLRSVPHRSAIDAWNLLIEVVTAQSGPESRAELESVRGIASSVIAEQTPQDAPIVLHGAGPRVRIYCIYDDAAIEGDGHDEKPLSFDPFDGAWELSLPCKSEDLAWVTEALRKKSARIVARDETTGLATDAVKGHATALEVNLEEFSRI